MSYKEEWIELHSLFLNWNISLYVLVSLQLCSFLCIWIVRSQHYIQCYCNHWNLGMHVKLPNENIQNNKKERLYLLLLLASKTALPTKESGTFLSHMIIQYANNDILRDLMWEPMITCNTQPLKKQPIFLKLASIFARFSKFQISIYSVLEKQFGYRIWAWYDFCNRSYHKKSLLPLFKNVTN